jgi:hypothetical protein
LSTILKALKRIDQTTPPPEDLQAWPTEIDTKKAVRDRVHKIWLYRKTYLALILAILIIAAGLLVYSQKHWLAAKIFPQKTSATGPIYQAKIYPGPDASKDAAPGNVPPQKDQDVRPGSASDPRPSVKAPLPSGLPRFPASQKIQKKPIFTSSNKSHAPEADISVKSNVSRPSTAGSGKSVQRDTGALAAAPEGKSASQATPVARSYRRLDESKLKLQAIAWSKDAAQRIAVINGHIVREGESIDGFVVNQIRQEDVVVNDGSASWQLEFGLK